MFLPVAGIYRVHYLPRFTTVAALHRYLPFAATIYLPLRAGRTHYIGACAFVHLSALVLVYSTPVRARVAVRVAGVLLRIAAQRFASRDVLRCWTVGRRLRLPNGLFSFYAFALR
jgi:hypothetical protein